MASTDKRPNGRWRARYRDADGKQHAKHFLLKRDAENWLAIQTASVVKGQHVDPRSGRITFAQYAEQWEKSRIVGKAQARLIDNALRIHITPVLGEKKMARILRSDIQSLVKLLSERLAAGSVRNVYEVLARVFADAVEDKIVSTSPCRRITLPRDESGNVVPPTPSQVQAIQDAVPVRYYALVRVMAVAGLRIGEALGLDIASADFLRRTITVNQQYTQDKVLTSPKGGKARSIAVPKAVLDDLAFHLAQFPSSGPIFTDERGDRLSYRLWKSIWAEAANEAGFDGTTHDLRHYCASALISAGASVVQVQHVLGHASSVITLRTYAHLFPGDEDRIRNALDAAMSLLDNEDNLRTVAASE
jgi:integrase